MISSKIKGKKDHRCMKFKHDGKVEDKKCKEYRRVVCGRKHPNDTSNLNLNTTHLQQKFSVQMQWVLHLDALPLEETKMGHAYFLMSMRGLCIMSVKIMTILEKNGVQQRSTMGNLKNGGIVVAVAI